MITYICAFYIYLVFSIYLIESNDFKVFNDPLVSLQSCSTYHEKYGWLNYKKNILPTLYVLGFTVNDGECRTTSETDTSLSQNVVSQDPYMCPNSYTQYSDSQPSGMGSYQK